MAQQYNAAALKSINGDRTRKVAVEARGIPIPVSPDSPDSAAILDAAPQIPSSPPWAIADNSDKQPMQ